MTTPAVATDEILTHYADEPALRESMLAVAWRNRGLDPMRQESEECTKADRQNNSETGHQC